MSLPIRFFTLAWHAMPFLSRHLAVFESLQGIDWQWHICAGPSDTFDGHKAPDMEDDGTLTYLLGIEDHPRVKVSYDSSHYLTWRCNEMLKGFDGLAWQVDADEFWTREQIERMWRAFGAYPRMLAAYFWCYYFVGPDRRLDINPWRDTAGNNSSYEWRRLWRFHPGSIYTRHDPPGIVGPFGNCDTVVFTHGDTNLMDVRFNHYAFVLPSQVEFKTIRYGWPNALERWQALQLAKLPVDVFSYLPWLGHGTVIDAEAEHCWKA